MSHVQNPSCTKSLRLVNVMRIHVYLFRAHEHILCVRAPAFLRNKLYQIISFVHQCLVSVSITLFSFYCCCCCCYSNDQTPPLNHCTESIQCESFKMRSIFAVLFYHLKASKWKNFEGWDYIAYFWCVPDDEVITINLWNCASITLNQCYRSDKSSTLASGIE